MTQSISIKINESADELKKSNAGEFKHTPRPPGVNFYSIEWKTDAPGTVKVEQGSRSFVIGSALSVTGSDDPNFPEENILDWKINAGVSDEDLIGHDEARRKFFNILRGLRNAGWSRWISPGEPRLKAIDAINYMRNGLAVYGLDPDYELSLEQWMALPSRTTWRFHADKAYLDISLNRDLGRSDPKQPGAYFVEYALVSENERMRALVGPEKRAVWKAELPQQLAKMHAARLKKEEQLKDSHISIDTSYQDAPAPDATR